jgi:hypothetical protein
MLWCEKGKLCGSGVPGGVGDNGAVCGAEMIRILDMREATTSDFAFAVWDTISDRFWSDRYGGFYWTSMEDFIDGGFSKEFVERVRALLPNAKITGPRSGSGASTC